MNTGLTEIIFLLDRSGSMARLEEDTIGGFNGFVKRQYEQGEQMLLTTILFDDQYELLWNGVDAAGVHLTNKEYFVRGGTALLDAVGKTIVEVDNRLRKTPEEHYPRHVIFVITTDGYENASQEFTQRKVKDLIAQQKEKYQWQFIFLGANIDAALEAENLGISEEDAYQFESTQDGVEKMYEMICEEVTHKRNRL